MNTRNLPREDIGLKKIEKGMDGDRCGVCLHFVGDKSVHYLAYILNYGNIKH